jgi:uncharacterized protein YqhQ
MSKPEGTCPTVGGQAVIEGVMMRGPSCLAVAVRNPHGEIVVRDQPWHSVWEKLRFLRWPFLRGAVVLGESLANGMSALSYSARIASEGEEADGKDAAAAPVPDRGPAGPAAKAEPAAKPDGKAAAKEPPSFGWLMVPTLLFALLVFKGVPHLVALGLDALVGGRGVSGYLFHVVDGAAKLLLFVGYLLAISRMKDIQRVFAYHGAEHKAIATHEAREPLTVGHARTKSRFHPRCGTAFLLFVIVVGVLLYMAVLPVLPPLVSTGWMNQLLLVLLKIVMLLPIAGLSYEVIRLSGKYGRNPFVRAMTWPGLMLQRLVTREPTDDQLEIALVSLATALAREEATVEARATRAGAVLPEREVVFPSYATFQEAVATWRTGAPERPLASSP